MIVTQEYYKLLIDRIINNMLQSHKSIKSYLSMEVVMWKNITDFICDICSSSLLIYVVYITITSL